MRCLVNAAGSDGRRNTIQCVDSTVLHEEVRMLAAWTRGSNRVLGMDRIKSPPWG